MGDAYDPALRTLAHEVAATQGLALSDVVYAGLLGPAYETPAEVAYLRAIGAQTVGMSTVPEVIVARALGMRVLGISLVTNVAGGAQLSHDEVLLAGKQASESLTRLVVGILARL
jgi:purine-nucleoside phosphorylase